MIENQIKSFLLFFIIGIIIGFIIDFFRALRKVIITTDLVTLIEDIILLIILGIISTISVINLNGGQIRFYILLGMVLGFFSYILTISKPYVIIIKYLVGFILNITKQLFYYYKKVKNALFKIFFKDLH